MWQNKRSKLNDYGWPRQDSKPLLTVCWAIIVNHPLAVKKFHFTSLGRWQFTAKNFPWKRVQCVWGQILKSFIHEMTSSPGVLLFVPSVCSVWHRSLMDDSLPSVIGRWRPETFEQFIKRALKGRNFYLELTKKENTFSIVGQNVYMYTVE